MRTNAAIAAAKRQARLLPPTTELIQLSPEDQKILGCEALLRVTCGVRNIQRLKDHFINGMCGRCGGILVAEGTIGVPATAQGESMPVASNGVLAQTPQSEHIHSILATPMPPTPPTPPNDER